MTCRSRLAMLVIVTGLAGGACVGRRPGVESPPAAERPAPEEPATPRPPAVDPTPQAAAPDAAEMRQAIARARALLASLDGLALTPEQRLNLESAASFVSNASDALAEGDVPRASTLSDKALTLLDALASEVAPPRP